MRGLSSDEKLDGDTLAWGLRTEGEKCIHHVWEFKILSNSLSEIIVYLSGLFSDNDSKMLAFAELYSIGK